jgi:NADPH:quinone reductase-like Zn-dependent oxidoreductase
MKAAICDNYGTPAVLKIQEVEKPIPKNNQILIKVHAASVTAADIMMRKGIPKYGRLFIGLVRPKIKTPGTGFSGVVEELGTDVTSFNLGDSVFGEVLFSSGTNAEYVCVNEKELIFSLPEGMSYEEAASICDGALTSLNFLQNLAKLKVGQSVLINGASGSLGTAAIQLAKIIGADVTGVCSGANTALVNSLGADDVIDYAKEDFTKNDIQYDVIYDTVGKLSYSQCAGSLTKKGVFVSPVLSFSLLKHALWTAMFSRKKAKFSATGVLPILILREMLVKLVGFIENGELKSVMDKRFTLSEIADAHRYVETGHKVGNVTLKL